MASGSNTRVGTPTDFDNLTQPDSLPFHTRHPNSPYGQQWKRWSTSCLTSLYTVPGKGIANDIKARWPFYWSDWSDAWNYRVVPATVFTFFANVLPGIAFSLDLIETTNKYGVVEVLLSSFMAAFIFSVFGAQPLCIAGVTGPITVLNKTIYDILNTRQDAPDYLQFIAWVYLWGALLHFVAAILNWCNLLRFVTRFSCDTFGFFVSWVYLQYGIQILTRQLSTPSIPPATSYLSILLAILTTLLAFLFQLLSLTSLFNPPVRRFLADYGMPISIVAGSGMAYWGRFNGSDVPTLPVLGAFERAGGGWVVRFWEMESGWVGVAFPFGVVLFVLFFFDHNVSSLIAQGSEFPLRKPPGFHYDFFLLGLTTFLAGLLGFPAPNGLIPQAPLHTRSLVVMGFEEEGVEDGVEKEAGRGAEGRMERGEREGEKEGERERERERDVKPLETVPERDESSESSPSSRTQTEADTNADGATDDTAGTGTDTAGTLRSRARSVVRRSRSRSNSNSNSNTHLRSPSQTRPRRRLTTTPIQSESGIGSQMREGLPKTPKAPKSDSEPELKSKNMKAVGVVEQRVSNLAQGGLCVILCSGPFLGVLGLIPRGVLAGLFWYMGIDALLSSGVTLKFLHLLRDRELTPPTTPLLLVRPSRLLLFVLIELAGFGITFAIVQTKAAIGFPIVIALLVPVAWWVVPRCGLFSEEELRVLDGPTASAFTMESVGGAKVK